MKLTVPGKDLIIIDESNIESSNTSLAESKIHLIKLNFVTPTFIKVSQVLDKYPLTNRFIIEDNIKVYNDILKNTSKKYYVQNYPGQEGIISFFRKNNKVLLCIPNLAPPERQFALTIGLNDILRNLEIIMIDESNYKINLNKFKEWNGNVVLFTEEHGSYL